MKNLFMLDSILELTKIRSLHEAACGSFSGCKLHDPRCGSEMQSPRKEFTGMGC